MVRRIVSRLAVLDRRHPATPDRASRLRVASAKGRPAGAVVDLGDRTAWRLTFRWESGDVLELHLEQYHPGAAGAGHAAGTSGRGADGDPGRPRPRAWSTPRRGLASAATDTPAAAGRHRRSAEISLRLGRLCGNGPEIWLNLQAQYDLAHARARSRCRARCRRAIGLVVEIQRKIPEARGLRRRWPEFGFQPAFAAVSRCSELSYETGQWSITGLRPKSKTAWGHPTYRP